MRGPLLALKLAAAGIAGSCASALADPILYLDLTNGSHSSGVITSSTGQIDVSGLQVGNYDTGAGVVNTTPNNLAALDFANFSTTGAANPGTLQIEVSATGLTAPIASLLNFATQASGNILDGTLLGMTIYAYADSSNAAFGTKTLLDTINIGEFGNGRSYSSTNGALWAVLGDPFSETLIIDLTLAAHADISSNTSLVPTPAPEPATVALLAFAVLVLALARNPTGTQPEVKPGKHFFF